MSSLTIIIPCFNHAKFLKKRLDSILNQTYTDWELIIIDDNSTDNSVEILSEFVEKNLSKVKHFIINDSNSGSGYYSWKKGISLTQTKYIWIAETDDYSDLNFVKKLINVLESNEDIKFVFSASNYVEENKIIYNSSKRTEFLNVKENKVGIFNGDVLISKMPFETPITNGSSVIFKKPINAIPDLLFENKQTSDIFLWTYIVNGFSFAFVNERLNYFRRHSDSTTTKLSLNSLKNIYKENVVYLNFFNQEKKNQLLLNHYIKHYVWYNKTEVFNYAFLKKINNINSIDIKYFYSLVKFCITKIYEKK
jgi:glycosyltransferase involved in cell wall biosynthesis